MSDGDLVTRKSYRCEFDLFHQYIYIYIIIIVRYGREFNQLKRENKLDWQVSLLFSRPWFMNKTEVLV